MENKQKKLGSCQGGITSDVGHRSVSRVQGLGTTEDNGKGTSSQREELESSQGKGLHNVCSTKFNNCEDQ